MRTLSDWVSVKNLHRALKVLYTDKRLGETELAQLLVVEERCRKLGEPLGPKGRSMALRKVLLEILELAYKSQGNHIEAIQYSILKQRWVYQQQAQEVQQELGLPKSTYQLYHAKALQKVADQLLIQEQIKQSYPLPSGYKGVFLAPRRSRYQLLGREHLFNHLCQLIKPNGHIVLQGISGSGKTALAVEMVHSISALEQFPDGVLWAGLGRTADMMTTLVSWGAAMGLDSEMLTAIPELELRIATIRNHIESHRMLIVLDDVWTTKELALLRVGGVNCSYLITTRVRQVADAYIQSQQAESQTVLDLDLDTALQLLEYISPLAVEADRNLCKEIIAKIGGLPLSIILVGQYLSGVLRRNEPRRFRNILKKLKETEYRLRISSPILPIEYQPDIKTSKISLPVIVNAMYNELSKKLQKILSNLSVFPSKPHSFSREAACYVSHTSIYDLDELYNYSLIEYIEHGRVLIHQSIRDVINFRFQKFNTPEFNQSILRYSKHYLEVLIYTRNLYKNGGDDFIYGLKVFDKERIHTDISWEWLINHHQDDYIDEIIIEYAFMVSLTGRMRYSMKYEYIPRLESGLKAAIRKGNTDRVSALTNNIGLAYSDIGDLQTSLFYYEKALEIAKSNNNKSMISYVVGNIGNIYSHLGDKNKALDYLFYQLEINKELDDIYGQGNAFGNIGIIYAEIKKFKDALYYHNQALELSQKRGDKYQEGIDLGNIGMVYQLSGDLETAIHYYNMQLCISKDVEDKRGETAAISMLGSAYALANKLSEAEEYLRNGLELCQKTGDAFRESENNWELGLVLLKQGQKEEALEYLNLCIHYEREINHPDLLEDEEFIKSI